MEEIIVVDDDKKLKKHNKPIMRRSPNLNVLVSTDLDITELKIIDCYLIVNLDGSFLQ